MNQQAHDRTWTAQRIAILREHIAIEEAGRKRYMRYHRFFSTFTPWLDWNHPLHYAFGYVAGKYEQNREGYEAELAELLGGAK